MHDAQLTRDLFTPVDLGAIHAPNRILMAPLTRARAEKSGVPTAIMAEYYAQRASAGLIISEAIGISREGLGWPFASGLWAAEQTAGWAKVTEAVHAAGGRIIAQLWHMGRVVHSSFLDGAAPVSASATRAPDQAHTYEGKQDYDTARALELAEIPRLLEDYARAAANAMAAGFDGVQLHAANGYLIDQFLRDGTNLREDIYGGSIANRCRLLDEVVGRLVEVCGADRVSVRLSPNDGIQGVADSDPDALFTEAAKVLERHKIAFLEMRHPGPDGTFGRADGPMRAPLMRQHFTGPLVLNCDYTPEQAAADVAAGKCDAVSFGRMFISNPDLVERIRGGVALSPNKGVPQTWYTPGVEGYTDYPRAEATVEA